MYRIFTLEEANNMIPELNAIFTGIFTLNEKINDISKDIFTLQHIWGDEIKDPENPDHHYFKEKMAMKNDYKIKVKSLVTTVHINGCFIKDVQKGLVDFLYDNDGKLVLLCWKYGESRIESWHSLKRGFINRRPLEEIVKTI